MPRLALIAAALAVAAVAAAKRSDNPWCKMDPFLDPANDLYVAAEDVAVVLSDTACRLTSLGDTGGRDRLAQ
jgi:hypothetical protein